MVPNLSAPEARALLRWQKRVFWLKLIFYLLLLVALAYVGLKAGGNPCERCQLKGPHLGDEPLTCRELINITVTPYLEAHAQRSVIEEAIPNLTWSLG